MRILITLISLLIASLGFAQDKQLAVVSLDTLFISSDGGTSWISYEILPEINRSVYLTAAARHQTKPDHIIVGTSFEGIYESRDNAKTWTFISEARIFKDLYQGAGFYDEILALDYARDGSDDFLFRVGYGGDTYRFVRSKKQVVKIDPKAPEFAFLQKTFSYPVDLHNTEPRWDVTLPGIEHLPAYAPGWNLPDNALAQLIADFQAAGMDEARSKRRALAEEKRGIYLNPSQMTPAKYREHLNFIKKLGMNSVVIDFKDDEGYVAYDSKIPEIVQSKWIRKRFDAAQVIKQAHDMGIYVIARVVVFKDKQLSRFNNNQYSYWNKSTNKPWGVFVKDETDAWVQTEWWVDAYSAYVHDYNIRVAQEIEALGVDEIQFDYIRFPSDGDTTTLLARFNVDEKGEIIRQERMLDRVYALASFLKEARNALTIPIGTDVFGFNAWSRMSYLGQDIQVFSYFVDVISPMAYPSHYSRDFLGSMNYFDRARYIYEVGTERARLLTGNRSIIRNYVQAFLLGGETKFSDPQIFDYLNRQILGNYAGGGSGFTLWNNSGRYYMVDQKNFPKLYEGR